MAIQLGVLQQIVDKSGEPVHVAELAEKSGTEELLISELIYHPITTRG